MGVKEVADNGKGRNWTYTKCSLKLPDENDTFKYTSDFVQTNKYI